MKWTQDQVTRMATPDRNMQPPEGPIDDARCADCGLVTEEYAKCRCCGEVFCWRCDSERAIKDKLHTECAFTSYGDDRKRWSDEAERLSYQIRKLERVTCFKIQDALTLTAIATALLGIQHRMSLYGKDEE